MIEFLRCYPSGLQDRMFGLNSFLIHAFMKTPILLKYLPVDANYGVFYYYPLSVYRYRDGILYDTSPIRYL